VVDSGLIAISIPEIERAFDNSPRSTIAWVAAAFLVAQSSLLLVGGRLGDRYGRKRFFQFGLLLFSFGALLTAISPNIWLVIASRAVQGIGAAFLTSGALALVLPMFPAEKIAVVIGVWGTIGSMAAWLTPSAGALLVEHSWRYGFLVVAPIGFAAWFVGRGVLVDQPGDRSAGPTDRLSYILGPPALGLTVLVLARGERWGWQSPLTLGLGAVAAALLAAFAWRSVVATSPLFDLEIVRNRTFSANVAAGVCQQVGFYGWYITAPIVMRTMWGWSVREIGLALALGQGLASVGSPLGGQLVVRYGTRLPITLGALSAAAGTLWLTLTATEVANFWGSYFPMALLFGFGSGMCGTVTTGAALVALPSHMLGAGNSVSQLLRRVGSSIGVAIGVSLLGEASGDALLAGALRVWWFITVVHAAAVIPVWIDSRRPPVSR
jgi:EmrB/QacA subfamily drug resistance transporter